MSIQLDLEKCPFSRFGSYFSLSIFTGENGELGKGLYLYTHHGNSARAFRIDPVREGEVLSFETVATPSRLTLKPSGGGEIAFVISGNGTVRVKGHGVSLRLEMPVARWRFAYELPGGAWGFNMSGDGIQLALDRLRGDLKFDAPWIQGKGFSMASEYIVAILSPDRDDTFEAAIDEFTTAWIRNERPDFDTCCEEVAREFAEWSKLLPKVEPRYEATRDLAGYVNWSAVLNPNGNLVRRTMFMSKVCMMQVFGWDHAFNAMAHCSHDPDLAWDQMMVMADKQDRYGKPPQMMNDSSKSYMFSNPPVQGWALRRMWDENPAMMTPERLAEAYAFLSGWSNWLRDYRTWPGDVLPYYIHGFDSGWDNSTLFDEGVPLVSPDQGAFLVLQLEVLADIATALNKSGEAAEWGRRRDEMLAALIETLWKKDRFVGMLRPSGKIVTCESLITCMPMVLGRRLPEEIRTALVVQLREHLAPSGLATEKPGSSKYKECGYWRGPVWAPATMLVVTGLADIGENALLKTIVDAFCRICVENGFYENFDAMTGAGHFDTAYTWTSSVFMIFASQYS
jgi:putative isomerase